MSKCNIWPKFECHKINSNVKMRYSAQIRMLKREFERQNAIFGPNSNVKIGFSNVKIRYSVPVLMSK